MRATQLLDTYLKKHCQGIHLKRMKTLITATKATLECGKRKCEKNNERKYSA